MLSFRVQIAVVVLASVAMLTLTAVLVRDVIIRTESRLVEEARQQCSAAVRELRLQFEERAEFVLDDPLEALPWEAQDISLRGLSSTVMRSYDRVEGGFRMNASGRILGLSRPEGSLTAGEQALLLPVIEEASRSTEVCVRPTAVDNDIIVVAAAQDRSRRGVAWTLKRLAGIRDPVGRRQRWLLGALAGSALLGMGGIVSLWFFLRSGVMAIRDGLGKLEEDFHYRLPESGGDFGKIASAINRLTAHRLELEEELRRQDRLAALGKVVAGVAHEIRNPLNSMKLTLELLRRRLAKGAARAEELASAIQEVDRLDSIVGRLLAFGRPALTDRHVQNIVPLLDQAIRMVREQSERKRVRIELRPQPDPVVLADVDGPQIQQVMINLLLNAIDASPEGGVVTVGVHSGDGQVSVTVKDQGSGIPEEARPHVFDMYFTTKPEGTGLGLSVSREIIINHGGWLEFTSDEGGATFWMTLPGRRKEAREQEGIRTDRRG